jgi:hypothetical protein
LIESKTLGKVKWTNSTGVVVSDQLQVLRYDFENRLLKFKFKNYEELLEKSGTNKLKISFKDAKGKERIYLIQVIFSEKTKAKKSDFGGYETEGENEFKTNSNVTAKISKLTKFGKLMIEFSQKMKTDIDITQLSSNSSNLAFGRKTAEISNLM